jgi:excisionase family DNA binding protein
MPKMELLSTRQAAEYLQVSVARIQQWIWDGRLPAIKPSRDYLVDKKDLENIVAFRRGRPKKSVAKQKKKRYPLP